MQYHDHGVTIVDPYHGQMQHFVNEAQAYQQFIDHCGHARYSEWVKTAITSSWHKQAQPFVLIGFSAGASAGYKALDNLHLDGLKQFIGFYPSQIRHHLAVKIHCPVTLLFPVSEAHFEVDLISQNVSQSPWVDSIKTPYKHGFMNPFSTGYEAKTAPQFYHALSNVEIISEPTTSRQYFRKIILNED